MSYLLELEYDGDFSDNTSIALWKSDGYKADASKLGSRV
jgi:hypothetical protein